LIVITSYVVEILAGGMSLAGASSMLICASPGILFLLSWYLSRRPGPAGNPAGPDKDKR
jgi:hypothetical protein